MRKLNLLLVLFITLLSSCGKDDFYDKFVPEILYYQNADVENADFKEITLATGVSQYTVKARVSAPMNLKEISIYKVTAVNTEELLDKYTDFQLSPKVYKVSKPVSGLSGETTIKIVARDQDNKTSTKNFKIKVTP